MTTDPLNPVIQSSFTYTYDQVGSRDTLTTVRSNVAVAQTNLAYVYDGLNRLTQATRPLVGDPDETFQYDPVGNRLSRDGQTVNSVFDDANRLSDDTAFTYAYDANGNLIQKTDKATGEVTDYTWDVQNQLIKIEEKPDAVSPPTQTIAYRYDGQGRRIQKDVDGVLTSYVYDQEDIVLEFDGLGTMVAHYTHGPGIDFPLEMERGGQTYYYHYDGLGSVTELTDSSGTVAQAYLYNAFGTIVQDLSSLVNPFTYTAREFDPESNLYFYRTRYYDGNIGRFISEDRKGLEGSFNLYSYVGNTPINTTDPFGFYGTSDCQYYLTRCRTGFFKGMYCDLAFLVCSIAPTPKDPDPTRDDDFEGFARCFRKCLQDCDAKGTPIAEQTPPPPAQNQCSPPQPIANGPRTNNPVDCHGICGVGCAKGKNPIFQ